jgi:hypothetical protein
MILFLSVDNFPAVSAEATGTGIGPAQGLDERFQPLVIESFFQDGLYGSIPGTIESEGAETGGFETYRPIFFGQRDDSLSGAQVIQNMVFKEALQKDEAVRTDFFSLPETPLRITHLVGDGFRRQMFVHGGTGSWPTESWMDGNQFVLIKDLHKFFCTADPQLPVNKGIGSGVITLPSLQMAVSVEFRFTPDSQLRRNVRKGFKKSFFYFYKTGQRSFASSTVDAISCGLHHPLKKLSIAIPLATKLPEGKKTAFYVFYSRFHDALFFGISRGAGRNEKAISLGKTAIGSLNLGIIITGSGNSAFGVIDNYFRRDAAKAFKGPAVTSQPGKRILIGYDLGILMPAPGEGHDKKPSGKDRTRFGVGNDRPLAEVNLSGFPRGEIQDDRGLNIVFFKPLEKAPYGRVTTAKTVVSHQGSVNRCPLDALLPPSGNLIPVRINRRNLCCATRFDTEDIGDDRLIGNRLGIVQPTRLQSDSPELPGLLATHEAALGNLTV